MAAPIAVPNGPTNVPKAEPIAVPNPAPDKAPLPTDKMLLIFPPSFMTPFFDK